MAIETMTIEEITAGGGLLTCQEVARLYNVDASTVRRWAHKGVFTVVKVGPTQSIRIPRQEAERHFKIVPGAAA